MTEGAPEPHHDGTVTSVRQPRSPWPLVVLTLGVVLIIAAAGVGAVALWPRGSPEPVSASSPKPTFSTPAPKPTMSPTTEAGLSAAELAERYGDAVWRVETDGCGYEGVGSPGYRAGPPGS